MHAEQNTALQQHTTALSHLQLQCERHVHRSDVLKDSGASSCTENITLPCSNTQQNEGTSMFGKHQKSLQQSHHRPQRLAEALRRHMLLQHIPQDKFFLVLVLGA